MSSGIDEPWYQLRALYDLLSERLDAGPGWFDWISLAVVAAATIAPAALTIVLWRRDKRSRDTASAFERRRAAVLAMRVAADRVALAGSLSDLDAAKKQYVADIIDIGVHIAPSDVAVFNWFVLSRRRLVQSQQARIGGDFTRDPVNESGKLLQVLLEWLHGQKTNAFFAERHKAMKADAAAATQKGPQTAVSPTPIGELQPFVTTTLSSKDGKVQTFYRPAAGPNDPSKYLG